LPESWGPELWHPKAQAAAPRAPRRNCAGYVCATAGRAGLQQCPCTLTMTSPWPGPPRGAALGSRHFKLQSGRDSGVCTPRARSDLAERNLNEVLTQYPPYAHEQSPS
jgi:hypothetical protein